MPRPFIRPLLLSSHPTLFRLRVAQRQLFRALRWRLGPERFASTISEDRLPHKVYRHQSKLRRYLSNATGEVMWQENKVHNHSLAVPHLNGVIIRPGETLSFWKLVGRPTAERGFKEGMELAMGRARGGIGGGLCQIANLIHWLALHSPLHVTKRSNHSFDPFPDQGCVIPYGTGAALFYNFIDLWVKNPTSHSFQLRLWLTRTLLNGELRSDAYMPVRYRIFEKNGRFTQIDGQWFRHNEIWRETVSKGENGGIVATEMLYENHVRVLYQPLLE